MCLFRKKTKTEKLVGNVNNLKDLANKMDNLTPLCASEEIKAKVNKIKEDITYLKTSVGADAAKLETKILNLIDDCRIKLSANQEEKADKILDEIIIVVKQRENVWGVMWDFLVTSLIKLKEAML